MFALLDYNEVISLQIRFYQRSMKQKPNHCSACSPTTLHEWFITEVVCARFNRENEGMLHKVLSYCKVKPNTKLDSCSSHTARVPSTDFVTCLF